MIRKLPKARVPQAAVLLDPGIDHAQRFWNQRVLAALRVLADLDEARVKEDGEMAGDAGLVEPDAVDQFTHGAFAFPQFCENPAPGRVCQDGKHILHDLTYGQSHIWIFVWNGSVALVCVPVRRPHMAFDEALAERVREMLPNATEKKMFGGVCWMDRGNMVVGVMGSDLLARVATEDAAALLKLKGVEKFTMGGKMPPSNKGWLNVSHKELATSKQLATWVQRCSAYTKTLPAK